MGKRFRIDDSAIVLEAVGEETRWNGWSVPLVTADQMRAYAAAVAADDRNANISAECVSVRDGRLIVGRTDSDDPYDVDIWEPYGETTADGRLLYALEGWCWVPADDDNDDNGR